MNQKVMLCCFLCFLIGFYFHWIMGKSVCRGVVEGHPGTPGHGGLAHRQADCDTWLQTASYKNSSDAYCISNGACFDLDQCTGIVRLADGTPVDPEEVEAAAATGGPDEASASASQEPDIGEMAAHDDSNEGRRRAVNTNPVGVGPGS